MGWDVTQFAFDGGQGAAKVFNYELAISDTAQADKPLVVSGDGVVRSGQVHFNRQDKLKAAAAQAGASPEGFISTFAHWVLSQHART